MRPADRPTSRFSRGWRSVGDIPLLRALLSAILPGTGQLSGGARRRGLIMLSVAVGLALIGIVAVASKGIWGMFAWVVDPSVLVALFFLNILLVVFRLYAVLDTYLDRPRTTRLTNSHDRSRAKALVATGLAVILLLTALPHAFFGYYTYTSYDLVKTLFASEDPRGSNADTDDTRLTMLILGTDAGYQRAGKRADSIMVAAFDLGTGHAAIFGIPRETGSLPLDGATASTLGHTLYENPIGYLYSIANRHPELAPAGGDAGAVVLSQVASDILGIPVEYYVVINMDGFIELVDALGGVTLNVPEDFWVCLPPLSADDHWHTLTLPAGVQNLSGMQALEFARSRAGNSDASRMGRQRCVITGLLSQTGVMEAAFRFSAVADVMKERITTNMSVDAVRRLISVLPKLKTDSIINVGLTPPAYTTGKNRVGFDVLDLPLAQSTVQRALEDPENTYAELASVGTDTTQSTEQSTGIGAYDDSWDCLDID